MAASPVYSDQRLPVRRWIGGFMLLLASIWFILLVRDFYISVLARDATATHAKTFWRQGTLISAIAVVLGLGVGWFLFRPSYPQSKRYGNRHRRPRTHPPTNAASAASEDEPQAASLSSTGIGEPSDGSPSRVKIRVKRRIRERIRKKE